MPASVNLDKALGRPWIYAPLTEDFAGTDERTDAQVGNLTQHIRRTLAQRPPADAARVIRPEAGISRRATRGCRCPPFDRPAR